VNRIIFQITMIYSLLFGLITLVKFNFINLKNLANTANQLFAKKDLLKLMKVFFVLF